MKRAKTPERVAELEAELALPPFPEELRFIWAAFRRIRSRNGGNGFGPTPISWADLDAFDRLSGLRLLPWEIEIIEVLDDLYFASRQNQEDDQQ